MTRKRKIIDGVEHIRCASCENFYPVDRRHFYMQRRAGLLHPHSWCRACYLSNSGRGKGMRIGLRSRMAPVGETGADRAQAMFLQISATESPPLVGPAL